MDLAFWALRTSPNFTTGVKISVLSGFLTRSQIRKSQLPFALSLIQCKRNLLEIVSLYPCNSPSKLCAHYWLIAERERNRQYYDAAWKTQMSVIIHYSTYSFLRVYFVIIFPYVYGPNANFKFIVF